MSSWVALNVAYDGEWEMPDLFLSRITATEHPNEGFDLLMYVFEGGDRGTRALDEMRDIALEHGIVEELVSVKGNDTSGIFRFKQLSRDGEVLETWSSGTKVFGTEDIRPVEQRVEDEIGRRPVYGGNY